MTDPVCHIPPVVPKSITTPNNLPSIPLAQPNIASLVSTVNQMRQLIQIISGQLPTMPGPQGGFNTKPDKDKKGTWVEQSREVETVKVYNPDDKEQFVEIERVNRLVMNNKDTGQRWTWER